MRTELICEALVREILDAQRWSAIEAAALALIQVRHMARQMEAEMRHLRGDGGNEARAEVRDV